jgi:hypothetical protein
MYLLATRSIRKAHYFHKNIEPAMDDGGATLHKQASDKLQQVQPDRTC